MLAMVSMIALTSMQMRLCRRLAINSIEIFFKRDLHYHRLFLVLMSQADFDRLVEQAVATIPARFRKKMTNVVIVVEPEPPHPELLGLHESNPPFPDKITIYQGPHERATRTPSGLFRLVQETVLHEVGHFFGMDELRVQRMERARRKRIRKRSPLQ